ncbi:MAG: hypothetical protein RL410_1037 [Actinomycetota bacterium]
MKRFGIVVSALALIFAATSTAQAYVTHWSTWSTLVAADGISGSASGPFSLFNPLSTSTVVLANGRMVTVWGQASPSQAGWNPTTNQIYSSEYVPAHGDVDAGWTTPVLRYTVANTNSVWHQIQDLTAVKMGDYAVGFAFTRVDVAANSDIISQHVYAFSASSAESLNATTVFKTPVKVSTTYAFNTILGVGGYGDEMTIAFGGASTLNGEQSSVAVTYEPATQDLSSMTLPTVGTGKTLVSMQQAINGTYIWRYRDVASDYWLAASYRHAGALIHSEPENLSVDDAAAGGFFVAAPPMKAQVGGVSFIRDANNDSYMYIVSTDGTLHAPVFLSHNKSVTSAAIDMLGYVYIVSENIQNYQKSLDIYSPVSHTVTLVVGAISADNHVQVSANASGRVVLINQGTTSGTIDDLLAGLPTSSPTTIPGYPATVDSTEVVGGLTGFLFLQSSFENGIEYLMQTADAPAAVSTFSGRWTDSESAHISWAAPTSDPDLTYSWVVDCGQYGQRQGESVETYADFTNVSALLACSIDIRTVQGAMKSSVAHWRLAPQTVTKVSAVKTRWAGPSSAKISWTASSTSGANYSIKVLGTKFSKTVTSTTSSVVVAGLNPKKVYRVEVTATKNGAKSAAVAGGISAAKVASAPQSLKFSGIGAASRLSWTAPKTNASSVYGYRVMFKVGTGKYVTLKEVTTKFVLLNQKYTAKAKVTFQVIALTGLSSKPATSPTKNVGANGYLA